MVEGAPVDVAAMVAENRRLMAENARLEARCNWPALCAALAALALLAWPLPREWLDWQPALVAAQPWRAVTAAFVHWTPLHLGGGDDQNGLLRLGQGPTLTSWSAHAAEPLWRKTRISTAIFLDPLLQY